MDDFVTRHGCIDCRREVAADLENGPKRAVRKCVDQEGPKRCVTHNQAFVRSQRKKARARSIERTYDISAEDAYELLLLQGGRCWLCQRATGATKSLAVDHDHVTNEVRGRLCGPCNQFIGRLGDDPEAAQRLVGYLTGDTPYRRLRATQLIAAATQLTPVVVSISAPVPGGRELFADWHFPGATVGYRWRVRDIDGNWSVENVADAEPRVATTGECDSCHALPDQPHTEYCKRDIPNWLPASSHHG